MKQDHLVLVKHLTLPLLKKRHTHTLRVKWGCEQYKLDCLLQKRRKKVTLVITVSSTFGHNPSALSRSRSYKWTNPIEISRNTAYVNNGFHCLHSILLHFPLVSSQTKNPSQSQSQSQQESSSASISCSRLFPAMRPITPSGGSDLLAVAPGRRRSLFQDYRQTRFGPRRHGTRRPQGHCQKRGRFGGPQEALDKPGCCVSLRHWKCVQWLEAVGVCRSVFAQREVQGRFQLEALPWYSSSDY